MPCAYNPFKIFLDKLLILDHLQIVRVCLLISLIKLHFDFNNSACPTRNSILNLTELPKPGVGGRMSGWSLWAAIPADSAAPLARPFRQAVGVTERRLPGRRRSGGGEGCPGAGRHPEARGREVRRRKRKGPADAGP